jgi:hypothetical protein
MQSVSEFYMYEGMFHLWIIFYVCSRGIYHIMLKSLM